jgi:Ca-activated chloride channel homolog
MFRFGSYEWAVLFIIVGLIIFFYKKIKTGSFLFSDIKILENMPKKLNYRRNKLILRLLALIFLILAMMRPQNVNKKEEILTKGIDMMLVQDISGSMQAIDFKPNNRLDASKIVIADFIKGRKNDRIGLVIFSAHSFTQCPLTTDYGVLLDVLETVKIGIIEDGTAIGMALATAVKHLKDREAKSKIIILLTDGVNNSGKIDPLTAANLAKTLDIKVYTIGVGKRGITKIPINHPILGQVMGEMYTEIDEKLLTNIAEITGGIYFRATDERMLKEIYNRIDSLERTEIKTKEYFRYKEYFPYFVWIGFFFLFLEILLFYIIKPKFP